MRTWGRVFDELGNGTWIEVLPDANGFLDSIMVTTLIQCLKLNLGESPFYSNLGIPEQQTVMTQIYPDYYVNNIQQWFAPQFASLLVSRQPTFQPTYLVTAVTQQGSVLSVPVAV
jgi:hypothetical protein